MWTQAPEVVFTAAPQLLIKRRHDPVLGRGWEEIMRLQAVGWSKQSPSTTIMFAPSVRLRYLGEGAGQTLRFDVWFQVRDSFLKRQSKAAAHSAFKPPAPEIPVSSLLGAAASPSATPVCNEQRGRLLGEGVECDLCQIVQGTAAAVLANPCAYYKHTFRTLEDKAQLQGGARTQAQLCFRAQVFRRQPDLSFVRAESGKEENEQSWPPESALTPEPASHPASPVSPLLTGRTQQGDQGEADQAARDEGHEVHAAASFRPPSDAFHRSVRARHAPCTLVGGRMHAPNSPAKGRPSARLGSRAWVSQYAALLGKWETKAREQLLNRLADRCCQSQKGTRFERWLAAWQTECLQLFDRFATVETDNRRTQTLDSVAVAGLFARSGIMLDSGTSAVNPEDTDVELGYRISRQTSLQIMKHVLRAKVTRHELTRIPHPASLICFSPRPACTATS